MGIYEDAALGDGSPADAEEVVLEQGRETKFLGVNVKGWSGCRNPLGPYQFIANASMSGEPKRGPPCTICNGEKRWAHSYDRDATLDCIHDRLERVEAKLDAILATPKPPPDEWWNRVPRVEWIGGTVTHYVPDDQSGWVVTTLNTIPPKGDSDDPDRHREGSPAVHPGQPEGL